MAEVKMQLGYGQVVGSGLLGESSFVGVNPITGASTMNFQVVVGGLSGKLTYSDDSGATLAFGQGFISGNYLRGISQWLCSR